MFVRSALLRLTQLYKGMRASLSRMLFFFVHHSFRRKLLSPSRTQPSSAVPSDRNGRPLIFLQQLQHWLRVSPNLSADGASRALNVRIYLISQCVRSHPGWAPVNIGSRHIRSRPWTTHACNFKPSENRRITARAWDYA